ncbi:secretogranin-2b [Brachionichthys hirsutus]|uniref:secretogranin-2b n=1 Tax=Brachionichthys hirsutus TaxID=412623 RepID=UPI003604F023
MLHFHHKLPTGGAVVLLVVLLRGCAVLAASLPRHYRLRGGESHSEGRPVAYPPGSDLIKALEYIENLKQRSGGRPEPADYDEVDKFRVLVQLASQQDGGPADSWPPPGAQRQDNTAEQLMKALLQSLQDQAGKEEELSRASVPRNDRRAHRHRAKDTEVPANPRADYGNFPRPHKKYPLMFEDEEDTDAKRATEDLEEQYAPQSLANLRSIFDELGRMPTAAGQKRNVFGDDDDEEEEEEEGGFPRRNKAYDDVGGGGEGGDEWVPVEEREETEEMVNRSHEEMDRALDDDDDQEEAEREEMQRRASPNQEDADDETKLVDYYLLKVLETSDQQMQKRDESGEQRKRLIRPSIVDPRTVKELLELSLKLHVPPQDLIDMLLTEELRRLHRNRNPHASARFTASQKPKIRYFSRKLPLKNKSPAEDMDREDFLDIIGVETISNQYPVVQRPSKTSSSSDMIPAALNPAANAGPVKIPPPSGRRENLFLSELNKMPLKRQADQEEGDGDVEDEVTTYLAAKILTEYPNGITKRDTQGQLKGQFPYELYERALKDYLGQAEAEKRPVAKREVETGSEEKANPTEMKEERMGNTSAPQTVEGGEEPEHRGKTAAGM